MPKMKLTKEFLIWKKFVRSIETIQILPNYTQTFRILQNITFKIGLRGFLFACHRRTVQYFGTDFFVNFTTLISKSSALLITPLNIWWPKKNYKTFSSNLTSMSQSISYGLAWVQANTFRSILVRHPLERTLSSYLSIFRMSDAHVHFGLTSYIKKFWLSKRLDDIKPKAHETQVDLKSRPTLTFRQWVHFLMDCPKEIPDCQVLTNMKFRSCFNITWVLKSIPQK